jgi:2-haloalkanoic acid dehalogenase type II
MPEHKFDAVIFDLLTALLDSWTLWNDIAGSEEGGSIWRRKYLELTYGQGSYRPYIDVARDSAIAVGYPVAYADALDARWDELAPWAEVKPVLSQLAAASIPMGVATNCSRELGRRAAARVGVPFQSVITAEDVGFYKPRPEPYLAVLKDLGTAPERTLFVAGSASDVPGARGVGMPVYWHNRLGLKPVDSTRPDVMEASLTPLAALVLGG